MTPLQIDVAVIGAGSAGLGARRAAEALGATTLMIDGGPYGTTCARVGCMPSKLLIAAAEVVHQAQDAARFGVQIPEVRVDGRAVMSRLKAERDRFTGAVVRSTEAIPEEQRARAYARFVGPNTLALDDGTQVQAKAVVIATGSAPWLPPVLRGLGDRVMTNEEVFEQDDLPKSLAVIGAGVIGLELGQAFHRLGVHTRLIAVDDLVGPLTSPPVKAKARALFEAELPMNLETAVVSATRVEGGVALTWRTPDGTLHEEVFEKILAATGRRPAVERLNLAAAGVDVDRAGVPLHDPDTLRCQGSSIFLAGDVTNAKPLLHEAADEARVAGANAARVALGLGEPVRYARRAPLSVVFSDPQMAMAGATHAELTRQGVPFVTGTIDFADQGRARVHAKNAGLGQVYASPVDGRLLGAELLGPQAEHLGNLLAWAIQAGLTVQTALRMPFYHPVVEEGLRTALRELINRLEIKNFDEVAPLA